MFELNLHMRFDGRVSRCLLVLFALCQWEMVAQPIIIGVTPTLGSPGDPVRIDGVGFYPGTLRVTFNGVVDPTAQATTYNQIQAIVPSGASSGPITVQVNSGQVAYSPQDFTVVGPGPYITGFDPPYGSPGNTITISGVHFVANDYSSQVTDVYFNGKPCIGLNVQSFTAIKVLVPNGATTGPITVRAPYGTNTTTTNFFLPPTITGFTPSSGRAGTNVLIRGTNFIGTTAVAFDNVLASGFTVLSNGALQVTVPALATTGKLRINTPVPGGTYSITNFKVLPTIYGFTPIAGPAGTSVTVTGANLYGASAVRFNGFGAVPTGVTFSQATAIVPATATTGPVSIVTTNGGFTNSANFYLPASITTFTPTNSPPGTTVKITGNNFVGTTNITFGGVPAASFQVTNNTTIGVVVPAGPVTGPIALFTPAGVFTNAMRFYGLPSITSFQPASGLSGTNVTIYGTNFLGAKAVRFNGLNAASFTATNNGFIRAVVPNNATTGPISVVAPAGTNVSSTPFVVAVSDLSVSLTADPASGVFVGSNLTYTVVVTNLGPAEAPNVRATNICAPPPLVIRSAAASQGSVTTNGNVVSANLGPVPAGMSASLTIKVSTPQTGTITNTARVTSDFLDLATTNNTTSMATAVLPLPLLSIRLLTNTVTVSWSAALANYNLQFLNALLATNSWSNVTASPKTNSQTGEKFVNETNSTPAKFYRLRQP
jgi:hypothetical protein